MEVIGRSTDLVIGFSVYSALILLVAYLFFLGDIRKTTTSRVAWTLLLLSLSGLQIFHFGVWRTGESLFESGLYVLLLLLTPPSFYFFSRSVLLPGQIPFPARRDCGAPGPAA